MNELSDWVRQLRELRSQAGTPDLRSMAEAVTDRASRFVSHSGISEILNGRRKTPRRWVIENLVEVLTDNQAAQAAVMIAFDAAVARHELESEAAMRAPRKPRTPKKLEPPTPAKPDRIDDILDALDTIALTLAEINKTLGEKL